MKTQYGKLIKNLLSFGISLVVCAIPFSSFAGGTTDFFHIPHLKPSHSGFIFEVDDNIYAQTSEVTIHLEKRVSSGKSSSSLQQQTTEDVVEPSWKIDRNDFHATEELGDNIGTASSSTASAVGDAQGG